MEDASRATVATTERAKSDRASGNGVSRPLLGTPLAFFVSVFLPFLLYLPVLGYTFAPVDDAGNILRNPYYHDLSAQNLGYFFTHAFYHLYMPMTFCVWALCAQIAHMPTPQHIPLSATLTDLNPLPFHAANLLFHLGNTALLFAFLRKLRFRAWACAAGALFFAIHPVQIESVAWITGMNNLLAAFFGLIALNLYLTGISDGIAAVNEETTPTAFGSRFALCYTFATVAFIGALLSKPTAIVIPLFVAVLEGVAFRRPPRRWIMPWMLWILLSLICIYISHATTSEMSDAIWSPLFLRPFVAGDALSFYIAKATFPLSLAYDYARSPRHILQNWWTYVDWIVPGAVALAVWNWRPPRNDDKPHALNRTPWLRVALLLFISGVVSTLGFIPFYTQFNSTVADRYLYLALIGPAVGFVALLSRPASLVSVPVIAALAIVTFLGSLTVLRLPIWQNEFSFINSIAEDNSRSGLGHQLRGDVDAYHGDYQSAVAEYRQAERLWGVPSIINNKLMAFSLAHLGQYDAAVPPVANSVTTDPTDQEAWLLLWSLIPHLHDPEARHLETYMMGHLQKNARDDRAAFTLGCLMMRNAPDRAFPLLQFGARNDPHFSGLQYDFGVFLEQMHRDAEAEAQYQTTLKLDPTNRQAAAALAALRQRLGQ